MPDLADLHPLLASLLVVAAAVALLGAACVVGRYLRWRGEGPEPRDRGGHVRSVEPARWERRARGVYNQDDEPW